ncbi:hypothetical protein EW146_g2175 [Bondarzewia mesenterica]|uniref:ER membrane protein complex subunit 2 n=1 Tax=Bondarzewia mesenterica TaxID=1095465 RepID=A0A4S4M7P8_9AGAM|nr:hypothetical protein EW146_g2175 [Bondarzewia mesenterica]
MDLASALERLANYRTRNCRASQDIFENGVVVFRNNALQKLGDDTWSFLEQLTLASIDVGRMDVAEQCLQQLSAQFPGSPRVQCLEGIWKEATESSETVLGYYTKLLEEDPANAAAWKRQISVLRRMGRIERAVEELSQFLDTFYADVEGWLELADIYASCNHFISPLRYTYALQSLSHVLLLAPQNPFYVLQAAETAYTAGDICLAIKMFLMVVDMTDDVGDAPVKDSIPTGITVRAWYGVELVGPLYLKLVQIVVDIPPFLETVSKTPAKRTQSAVIFSLTYSSA